MTILDGQSNDRVLHNLGGNLTVEHLKITHGSAPAAENGGGGIKNRENSTLYLEDVVIEYNEVPGTDILADSGGGIENRSKLTVVNSTIQFNEACNGGGIGSRTATTIIRNSIIYQNSTHSGYGCGEGGGIYTLWGSLKFELTNVLVEGNFGEWFGGGLFFNGATVGNITDSTFRDNDSSIGAGIFNTGQLALSRVTLSGNLATSNGGAVSNNGTLSLVNVTVSGNSAPYGGGLMNNNGGSFSLDHCTIASNTASSEGYAYDAEAGSVNSIHNTILASSNFGKTCYLADEGLITDQGYNLSSDLSCGLISHAAPYHDWIGVPPDLYALADNGGPTWTMALNPMAYARDGADPATSQVWDQRGYFRPVIGDGIAGAISDIGAYEYLSFPLDIFSWMPLIIYSVTID
jgi:hypothetical protein